MKADENSVAKITTYQRVVLMNAVFRRRCTAAAPANATFSSKTFFSKTLHFVTHVHSHVHTRAFTRSHNEHRTQKSAEMLVKNEPATSR